MNPFQLAKARDIARRNDIAAHRALMALTPTVAAQVMAFKLDNGLLIQRPTAPRLSANTPLAISDELPRRARANASAK